MFYAACGMHVILISLLFFIWIWIFDSIFTQFLYVSLYSDYVASLMEETLQLASQKQKLRAEIPELQGKPPLCAGVDRISKDEAIEQLEAHRRFAKM